MTELVTPETIADDRAELARLYPYLEQYQQLALKHKIADIFQDNGGKYVELQIILGLTTNGKRMGNDATDKNGKEYEIKTVNINGKPEFTTHHHLKQVIIDKYRKVSWFFAIYKGIKLLAIYRVDPDGMEKHYLKWEAKLNGGADHINNTKIAVRAVMNDGVLVWDREGKGSFSLPVAPRQPRKQNPSVPKNSVTAALLY